MRLPLPRDRNLILLVGVLAIASVVYFAVPNSQGYRGGIAELDGYYYYIYLRSLQMDGDLEFGNEYATWANPFEFEKTPTGHHRNIFGVGPAILWSPFFLLAHGLALLGHKLGYPISLDGMSRFHQTVTFYGTLLYGWLALLFCYQIARQSFGRDHALWSTLGAALAGPLPFYCLTWASYSHAQAAMASSLMCLLWIRWRDAWTVRRFLCFGAVAGLLVLLRPAEAAFLILPLVEGFRHVWPAVTQRPFTTLGLLRRLAGPIAGALAALAVFSPQIVVWKILYGEFLLVPQGQTFMLWTKTAWHSTLFSPRNGLLTVAPLMAVGLLGLFIGARRRPESGWPLVAVFVGIVIVNGAAHDWWGWGFSARRFTAALPIMTFGMAAALCSVRERMIANPRRSASIVSGGVIALAIVFNLQWMMCFAQRNLEWYGIRSTEGLYMTVTHSLVERVYNTVGNPMSLPTSIAFSLRKGGTPKIYDRIDGSYLLGEANPETNPAARPYLHATIDFGDLRFRYFLSDSFGYPVRIGGIRYSPVRDREAHVFLPLNRVGDLFMLVGGRAVRPGTRVHFRFNRGFDLGSHPLPVNEWGAIPLRVPARYVERGINRLDLVHELPPQDPGSRCLQHGNKKTCAAVDIALVSGAIGMGNFAEVWVANRRVTSNQRGLNVVLIEPTTGRVLGVRGFDVMLYRAEYGELSRYLSAFPEGTFCAVASRGEGARHFKYGGAAAFARFGATGRRFANDVGFVALGVLGSPVGSAREEIAKTGHARILLGLPPPPWRVYAHYRAIRLR